MMLRSSSVVALFAALSLTACPVPSTSDGGDSGQPDAANPMPIDACSGGCNATQICDTARRTCVDACGGCDAGTCVKVSEGVFQCSTLSVACNGSICEPGQVTCLGGSCSCLSSLTGALDSCESAGKWCNGKVCSNPKILQQCRPGDTSAPCAAGTICQPVFAEDLAICVKECADDNACGRGEFCANVGTANGCLPAGLFGGQECNQNPFNADGGLAYLPDGGLPRLTVPASNTCLLKNAQGAVTDAPGRGTGNCVYAIFQFWDDGVFPFTTCRPPGTATEGQPCRDDYSSGNLGLQCGTGLQCVRTRGGDEGVCLRMCNAQPPAFGFPQVPACNANEACVNTLRYQDPNSNAVLGACMKTCNVFDAGSACAPVGTTPSSCVPTQASGELPVTANGDGICIPQRQTIAAVNQPCTETDPFRGAACASGQMCTSVSVDVPATCTRVCDLECAPSDGGVGPARCNTQPNARCSTGSCRRVTSTTGARLGYCL